PAATAALLVLLLSGAAAAPAKKSCSRAPDVAAVDVSCLGDGESRARQSRAVLLMAPKPLAPPRRSVCAPGGLLVETADRLCSKGGSAMEPRKPEKPGESPGEGQTSPPCSHEKKRRFRIVKLEERIAPGGGHGHGSNASCNGYTCYQGCNC